LRIAPWVGSVKHAHRPRNVFVKQSVPSVPASTHGDADNGSCRHVWCLPP